MPIFEYEAKTMDGQVVKGKMDGTDEDMIIESLRKKDCYPISIKQFQETKSFDFTNYKKITVKDISIFCRQFAFSISSGINMVRSLEVVKEQTQNPKLKRILDSVLEEIQRGKPLSESLGQHKEIPEMLIHMIEVGESSGTLDMMMLRMADYYDKESKLHQKVKQALTYPAIVCIFALGVIVLLVTIVLPKFTDTINSLNGGKLPLPTRMVLGMSSGIRHHGILIALVIAAIVFGIIYYKNTDAGEEKFHSLKLKIPVFGIINKKIITGRFARTFGTLMASGMPLIQSMNICSKVLGNRIAKNILLTVQEDVKKGESLAEALDSKAFFPPMLINMIKIGEESGTLDAVLEKTAEYYDDEVDSATEQLTTILEPLIIVVLAVIVGFIILSVVMPMFQMYNSVNNTASFNFIFNNFKV